jgi:hypothetical protein
MKREEAMRDIRSDLQERATLIDHQIKSAYAQFESSIQQLEKERDAKVGELKTALVMIARLIEFEDRQMSKASPAVSGSPLVALADRFMQTLENAGQMSRDELIGMAVKEGFFPDAQAATQGVFPMLTSLLRSEVIRELPNGNFAPPTISQTIKLRRVV